MESLQLLQEAMSSESLNILKISLPMFNMQPSCQMRLHPPLLTLMKQTNYILQRWCNKLSKVLLHLLFYAMGFSGPPSVRCGFWHHPSYDKCINTPGWLTILSDNHGIQTAGDGSIPISGTGDISSASINLHNVLFSPKLAHNLLSLPHVSSSHQLADIFTKAMTRDLHHFLISKLMCVDSHQLEREKVHNNQCFPNHCLIWCLLVCT